MIQRLIHLPNLKDLVNVVTHETHFFHSIHPPFVPCVPSRDSGTFLTKNRREKAGMTRRGGMSRWGRFQKTTGD